MVKNRPKITLNRPKIANLTLFSTIQSFFEMFFNGRSSVTLVIFVHFHFTSRMGCDIWILDFGRIDYLIVLRVSPRLVSRSRPRIGTGIGWIRLRLRRVRLRGLRLQRLSVGIT